MKARMMKGRITVLAMVFVCVMTVGSFAQTTKPNKKITPVEVDDKKPKQPTLHYYDKHGEPLETPVLFLADLDTVVKAKSGPIYPLFNGVSVGVNFADAVLKLAGQRHQSYDIWADVSLHNWFFPVIEMGVGFAENTPENQNYTYKGKPSFYAKIGLNYNFLYKSDPDYQLFAGFRAGFSRFSYDIENATVTSDFWGTTVPINFPRQTASSFYGEFLAGLKVKIAGGFSLGWTARYRSQFRHSTPANSEPWFIPGYGTRTPLGLTFSAIWTFGQRKSKKDVEAEAEARLNESVTNTAGQVSKTEGVSVEQ